MKAKCVNNQQVSAMLTAGQVYEIIYRDENAVRVMCDDGTERYWELSRFELLPDAPKSDWMRVDKGLYINMVTGMALSFEEDHSVDIYAKITDTGRLSATGTYADAFANLPGVNHDWSDK